MADPNSPLPTTNIRENTPGSFKPKGEHVIIVEPLIFPGGIKSPGIPSLQTPSAPTRPQTIEEIRSTLEGLKQTTPEKPLADKLVDHGITVKEAA